jgi:hypothetical protein
VSEELTNIGADLRERVTRAASVAAPGSDANETEQSLIKEVSDFKEKVAEWEKKNKKKK